MPYVWIDECECPGDCEHSERLLDGIGEALDAIKSGDIQAAKSTLGALANDPETKKAIAREKELSGLFLQWRSEGRPSGFLDWAHHKRKVTLT